MDEVAVATLRTIEDKMAGVDSSIKQCCVTIL
jgi:hypothetical protein